MNRDIYEIEEYGSFLIILIYEIRAETISLRDRRVPKRATQINISTDKEGRLRANIGVFLLFLPKDLIESKVLVLEEYQFYFLVHNAGRCHMQRANSQR